MTCSQSRRYRSCIRHPVRASSRTRLRYIPRILTLHTTRADMHCLGTPPPILRVSSDDVLPPCTAILVKPPTPPNIPFFFLNDTATPQIYTLPPHDAFRT